VALFHVIGARWDGAVPSIMIVYRSFDENNRVSDALGSGQASVQYPWALNRGAKRRCANVEIIGFVFLAVLVGSSVDGSGRGQRRPVARSESKPNQLRAFAPDEMHKTAAVRSLHPQKIDDMSVVFSEER